MNVKRSQRVLLIAPLVAGLALVGCSDDDDGEDDTETTEAPAEGDPADDGGGALDGSEEDGDDGGGAMDGSEEDGDDGGGAMDGSDDG